MLSPFTVMFPEKSFSSPAKYEKLCFCAAAGTNQGNKLVFIDLNIYIV